VSSTVTTSVTIVVAGRNDEYGGNFRERLFRTAAHNEIVLAASGLEWEYLFVEWNPVAGKPALSQEFVERVPKSRALVVPSAVHDAYSRHPAMPFHEMPAKNAGIRRAAMPWIVVTNADVLFEPALFRDLAAGRLDTHTLYRARRADVRPDASWEQMQEPGAQLPSGEGLQPPVEYLGAGGDFCLASRDLWHELRGFDERIRFSTRAKDWQFFLSAITRGVPVEFLGTVYHLDHGGGFRNTDPSVRRTAAAHFGGPWDVEFGLPTRNRDDWGLGTLESAAAGHHAIATLDGVPRFSPGDQLTSDALVDWIGAGEPDWLTAGWLHALYGAWRARRPLHAVIQTSRAAASLEGFLSIAHAAGISITTNWEWPAIEGFTLNGAVRADGVPAGTWVVTEHDGVLSVVIDGEPAPLWPERRPPDEPRFNPLLARRLLWAWIRMAKASQRRAAIFGAGSHTAELLSFGWPDDLAIETLVTSTGEGAPIHGLGVRPLRTVSETSVDAILLSSVSYEPDMEMAARNAGLRTIVCLYAAWPPRPLGCSSDQCLGAIA
jgi:hypothetical protein